jgi:hypothetical protein
MKLVIVMLMLVCSSAINFEIVVDSSNLDDSNADKTYYVLMAKGAAAIVNRMVTPI